MLDYLFQKFSQDIYLNKFICNYENLEEKIRRFMFFTGGALYFKIWKWGSIIR